MDNEEFKKTSLTFKLNKEVLVLVALVTLVAISGVQTVKLGKLKANNVNAVTAPATSSSTGSGSDLPSSLQNLPSQVGGC